MRRIYGIGETVLDLIFKNDSPTAAVPGGSTFNAIISLGRTVPKYFEDIKILMVTETGDDHVGDIVVSFLEKNGIDTSALTRQPGTQTTVSMAFLNERNNAEYEFYKDPAGSRLSADNASNLEIGASDIVLFGSFFAINPKLRGFVKTILDKAKKAGAVIYYDINFRKSHLKDLETARPMIEENCSYADFVRGSDEDFNFLYGSTDGREIFNEHIVHLCPNLIITRGAAPAEVYTEDGKQLSFPVPDVNTVSTIGAGDNFNAGFIFSIIAGGIRTNDSISEEGWERMIRTASSFSSAVCQSVFNYVDEQFEVIL